MRDRPIQGDSAFARELRRTSERSSGSKAPAEHGRFITRYRVRVLGDRRSRSCRPWAGIRVAAMPSARPQLLARVLGSAAREGRRRARPIVCRRGKRARCSCLAAETESPGGDSAGLPRLEKVLREKRCCARVLGPGGGGRFLCGRGSARTRSCAQGPGVKSRQFGERLIRRGFGGKGGGEGEASKKCGNWTRMISHGGSTRDEARGALPRPAPRLPWLLAACSCHGGWTCHISWPPGREDEQEPFPIGQKLLRFPRVCGPLGFGGNTLTDPLEQCHGSPVVDSEQPSTSCGILPMFRARWLVRA